MMHVHMLDLANTVIAAPPQPAPPGGGAVPGVGPAQMPPGFEKGSSVLAWVKWISLAFLIGGLMLAGARMAGGERHGDGAEHAGRIGGILIGVIVVSAAAALVGFLAS